MGLIALGIDQIMTGQMNLLTGVRSQSAVEFGGYSAAREIGFDEAASQTIGQWTPAALSMGMMGAGGLFRRVRPRTGGAMSGGYRGTGLTQAEVQAITADFRAGGGVIDQSLDAQRYLQTRGAGGLTFNHETILLPASPTRTAVFEELVHANQFGRGVTIEAGSGGVLRFEAEAAETLIRNRGIWQLPADEVRQACLPTCC